MSTIQIRNRELIQQLDGFRDLLIDAIESTDPSELKKALTHGNSSRTFTDPQFFTGPDYLEQMRSADPADHEGFPEQHHSFPISRLNLEVGGPFAEVENVAKKDLVDYFGALTNAVALFYPPKGFVGWHTNWNNVGTQILVTWSETGEGYFRYYDNDKGEVVTLQDTPGWSAHTHRFGPPGPDECWHAAYTDCPRITLAYRYFVDAGDWDSSRSACNDMINYAISEMETE